MAIESILSGLPQSVQDSINQSDPSLQGASNGPVLPGTGMPLPPNQAQNLQAAQTPPAAPEIGSTIAPGSLADKISAAFLQHLAQRQPPPPPSTQPQQSRGQRVASGINNVVSGVSNALGDASHSGDKPGGWLTGVENVMAARSARIAGTKQRDFENKQEAAKNDALIPKSGAFAALNMQ